jgi:pimeloyl-ACP methyl ester carboxylesterase
MSEQPPKDFRRLLERFDVSVWDDPKGKARVRLAIADSEEAWDFVHERGESRLEPASGEPHATITADRSAWRKVAEDLPAGMRAFRTGRLAVRQNLHLGVAFLAATSGNREPGRLEFRRVETRVGSFSTMQAGVGEPVVMIHGLGGTKASFLPTVAALGPHYRAISIDLPGFGDSDKPLGAGYDPEFFARAVVALLDQLHIERAHVLGNSMGGRVALELGMEHTDRVGKIGLLAPSLAWLKKPGWANLLRLVRPELGAIQPAPRAVVEKIVRDMLPGGHDGWTAAGIDEFLRAYLTPRGRAAFYAAARNIILEEAEGERGFWARLGALESDTLFIWGKYDNVVPAAFERHVRDALPAAEHVTLRCGHVPQLERPDETHAKLLNFLAEAGRKAA